MKLGHCDNLTPWGGGECPVPEQTFLEVHFKGGGTDAAWAKRIRWSHCGNGYDIIAYRVIEAPKPKAQIPEGFTPWGGGERAVPLTEEVECLTRCGQLLRPMCAGYLSWHHTGGEFDILAYRVIADIQTVQLLNHGHVRLIASMGDDLSIVRAARISYDAAWRTGEDEGKDAKLIEYLIKNKHTSPLECVQFTFDVKAPIFVFRQWHRHRTWSFNEISARYSELPEEYYIPEVSQITTQSKDNKQMRTGDIHPKAEELQNMLMASCEASFMVYRGLIRMGMPRELARGVLPVNTFSHMFCTVDLHNLSHFLKLRLHEHSQYEIRVYAQAMLDLIEPIVPVTVAALKKHVL